MGIVLLLCIGLAGVAGMAVGLELIENRRLAKVRRELMERMGAENAQGSARQGLQIELPKPLRAFASKLAGLVRSRPRESVEIERRIPEMIGVVCLGMESGMTFEGAFALYAEKFDTRLAFSCREAAREMRSGVRRREDVLGELSEQLGSRAFRRFSDAVARSVRFGSGLTPVLRELADEIRVAHKASREEEVAKAPTKMLLPTGLLILPAMLILVAGPFVLELVEQL